MKKGKFQSKYIVSLTLLKKNISMRKTHWLAQRLRKVKFRWNLSSGVVMATQNFKRNLLLILTLVVCFLLPLYLSIKREKKMSNTCNLFPLFGDPWPSRLLPSQFHPWVGKIPWRRAWQPTPVFLPGESCGQRSLVGYNPWGHKESDTTERSSRAQCM